MLDLDGDGIETTSTRDGTVILFDHDADGIKTGTGWIKPDDGWLVLDRNGNGTIDSGRELFGVDTLKSNGQLASDGFDALKDLDANQDGKIDSADSVFGNLRIWRDLNQDGISQSNELTTLSANNITGIGINSTAVRTDLGNGNVQTATGTFTRANGTTGTAGETNGAAANLDLLVNTFYRTFTTQIALTDQAKALPDLLGSGRVRDLSEAISLSTDLGNWVQTYTQQTTRQGQIDKLDGFIEKWANTADLKPLKAQADALTAHGVKLTYNLAGLTSGTVGYDDFVRKLGVVERFIGFTYGGANGQARFTPLDATSGNLTVTLAAEQIASISLAYDRFKTDIYESLLLQTRLSTYFDQFDIALLDGQVVLDFQSLENAFRQAIATSPRDGIIDLVEFLSAAGEARLKSLNWNAIDFLVTQLNNAPDLGTFGEELTSWTVRLAGATDNNLTGTSRPDLLVGSAGADTIRTGDSNDIILAKGGDDVIDGGAGDDVIDGGDGNDTITDTAGANNIKGGLGNDTITGRGTIEGGKGNDIITSSDAWSGDTYLFNLGDGKDTIADFGVSNALGYGGTGLDDTLKFGTGIAASAVTLGRSGNDLIFKVSATDQVTVKDWYVNGFQYLENVQFADGTLWDAAKLKTLVPALYSGTAAADSINGWDGIDKISALVGNDTINGYAGNDILDGGDGDDSINGGDGNDQVLGGLGADKIDGGAGDDVIDGGDGNDTITDTAGANNIKGGLGNDTITGRGTIEGGKGNDIITSSDAWSGDTYVFNVGDGKDTIADYGVSNALGYGGTGLDDTLTFGAGIAANQLWFKKVGNDLDVTRIGATEGVVVKDWYASGFQHIEQFKSADGKTLLDSQVDALVSAMAAFAPPSAGQTTLPADYQTALNPVIAANWK